MSSLNKQFIVGRLGKDPEIKQGQNQRQDANGAPISNSYCYIGVATDHVTGKNPDGTWNRETTWHNVTVNGHLADLLGKQGKKGYWVFVEGRTQHKKDEKTGAYFTNVIASQLIVLGRGVESSETGADQSSAGKPEETTSRGAARVDEAVTVPAGTNDDLPF